MKGKFWPGLLALAVCLFFSGVDRNRYTRDIAAPLRDMLLANHLQRLRRAHPDPEIVIAGIDDAVMQNGHFNRAVHARVISNLARAGARLIFYDVEFDEPRAPTVDASLCASVRAANRCVLAAAYRQNNDGLVAPGLIPGLEKAIASHRARRGLINIDNSSVQRQGMLLLQVDGETYLSAAAAIAAALNHLEAADVKLLNDRLSIPPLNLPVTRSEDTAGEQQLLSVRVPTVYSPPVTGPNAGKVGYPVVSYEELIDPASPTLPKLAGKIVMIGENTRGDTDLVNTPVGKMKGIEVHTQILDTLLNGPWLESSRPGSRLYWPDLLSGWALCVLLSLLLWSQPTAARMLLAQALVMFIALGSEWEAGRQGHVLNLPLLVAEMVGTFVACALLRFSLANRALASLIPREIARQLMRTGRSEVVRKEATVIVTDIRGYTSLSETKTPSQILQMLNEYHTETVGIFERHQGSVLNYQGDAQIVLFGYPKKLKDPARNAVLAALETSEAIDRLRKRWNLSAEQTFDVGAGVCTGLVVIGELGSASMQAEYTVIGETVRRCHKVQSMSNKLHSNVLVDQHTMDACKVKPRLEARGMTELDGLPQPVMLYGTPLEGPP